ncbi:type II toxin-antitoxin system PemK/MazF family toxin [Limosilactobacillus ingluviei]|uniref:type II toxin-antitoxin system PemK/MazF family toxin n=1 Tax=Limosilactobacillus ingluviei TaxID=148604 RepID=UPI0030B86475
MTRPVLNLVVGIGWLTHHFLVVSRYEYNKRSGLVCGLALTHKHVNSPSRFPIVDFENGTNGDALLLQLLTYDFIARNGKIIGHIHDRRQFSKILIQVQNIFNIERN